MFSVAIVMLPFFALAQAHFSALRSLTTTGTPINHNGDVNKCLGIFNADLTENTYIQVQNCDGSRSQSWTVSRGNTQVQVTGTNLCLDASSFPATGIALKIRQCTDNNPAQAWTYTDGNKIELVGKEQCVDLNKGDSTDGNIIQSWDCRVGNTNQAWTIPPTTHSTTVNPYSNTNTCLDVRLAVFATGTPVEIYQCNRTGAQKWTISRGTTQFRVTGTNFCLDASTSPADGVPMILRECNSNLFIPSWTYTDNDAFVSIGQNWCLDLRGGITTDHNPVQISTCTSTANQAWTTGLNQ